MAMIDPDDQRPPVLSRIANGSGIPRGYLGLPWCVKCDYRRAVPAAAVAWGVGW